MPDARTDAYLQEDGRARLPSVELEIHARRYADLKKDEQRNNSAYQLRERITRQTPAEVRKSVVPILVQNLRDAQTPQAREQLGRALAELGPAANDAVPVLEDCLAKAQSPEERAVVLRALGEMGPAAGANAGAGARHVAEKSVGRRASRRRGRPVSNTDPRPATPSIRPRMRTIPRPAATEWENAKNRILRAEGRVGVHDAGERFSPLALKEGRRLDPRTGPRLQRRGSRRDGGPADRPEDKAAKDRGREVAANGVCFVIHPVAGAGGRLGRPALRDAGVRREAAGRFAAGGRDGTEPPGLRPGAAGRRALRRPVPGRTGQRSDTEP